LDERGRLIGEDVVADGGETSSQNPTIGTLIRWLQAYGRDFWLVFWATFALNSSTNFFVLYSLELDSFGASPHIIGAVIGIWSLAALAARPIAGPLVERVGRRRSAMWLLAIDTFIVALYIPIGSLGWHVYAVRVIHGAVEGTARVALFALVYDLLPEGREGEAMAVFSTCGLGSAALAPILGEIIIRRLGFTAFFVAIMACTAAAAIATRVMHASAPPRPAISGDRGVRKIGYNRLLFDARLLPLWIATLLFSLSISSRLSFVAPFAARQGIKSVGTYYYTVYSLTGVVVRLFSGRLVDRIGMELTLAPSLMVLGVGVALIAATGHFGMLELAAAVGGLGHGYVYPSLTAMVIGRTEAGATGRSSSIYQSLYDIGAMLGPYGLGAIAGALGYGAMFVTSGSLALLGAFYFAAADREARESIFALFGR